MLRPSQSIILSVILQVLAQNRFPERNLSILKRGSLDAEAGRGDGEAPEGADLLDGAMQGRAGVPVTKLFYIFVSLTAARNKLERWPLKVSS